LVEGCVDGDGIDSVGSGPRIANGEQGDHAVHGSGVDVQKSEGRREPLGRAEQHRRVPVMAAGMHLVRDRRGVIEVVLLLQVQRIHVGAQPDRLLARPVALQGADDAGRGEAAMHLEAPGGELVGHDLRCPLLLERGFGMAVDVATNDGEIGQVVGEKIGCVTGHGRKTSLGG